MGPQLVFGSLLYPTHPNHITSHSAYRFVQLNNGHSQRMSVESSPQYDPVMALGNNLWLTQSAPNTIKSGPDNTLINPQEASVTEAKTPASWRMRPTLPKSILCLSSKTYFSCHLKRTPSYPGFALVFSAYMWGCITLPIMQSLVDTWFFGHNSIKIHRIDTHNNRNNKLSILKSFSIEFGTITPGRNTKVFLHCWSFTSTLYQERKKQWSWDYVVPPPVPPTSSSQSAFCCAGTCNAFYLINIQNGFYQNFV